MGARKNNTEAIDLIDLLDAYAVKDKVRLECVNSKKNEFKFYDISIKEESSFCPTAYSVSTHHGRIGQRGVIKQAFVSFNKKECLAFADNLYRQKIKKGYKEV